MKTQVRAWSCLGAGLWWFCVIGIPSRSEEARTGQGPHDAPGGVSVSGRSSREDTGTACRLARGGMFREAWSLATALPAHQRNEGLPLVSAIQAATDPLGAWQATLSIGEPDLRQACQVAVLRSGSDGSLPDLAEMADSFPEDSVREAMLREVVSRWALQDPCGLFAWPKLATLPAAVRDEAARCLVIQGDRLNRTPAIAGAWAEAIEEPQLRTLAMEAAAREWFAEDPAAASEFVRRSPRLDDARRAAILSALAGQEPP
jgi:hypothetical protein